MPSAELASGLDVYGLPWTVWLDEDGDLALDFDGRWFALVGGEHERFAEGVARSLVPGVVSA